MRRHDRPEQLFHSRIRGLDLCLRILVRILVPGEKITEEQVQAFLTEAKLRSVFGS